MSADRGSDRQESQLNWEPRRQMTLDAARRRGNIIKILRISFFALSVGIIVVIGLFVGINALRKDPAGPTAPLADASGEVRMINPRFSGQSNSGQPYTVIADTATNRNDDPETTDLINPRLDTAPGANSSQVSANSGVYERANNILTLNEDVQFTTPDGYTYKTEHAKLFIDSDNIFGEKPIVGTGPMGEVRADSYKVFDGGKKITFSGHVHTVIERRKSAAGETNE